MTFKLSQEFKVPYGSRTKGFFHKTCHRQAAGGSVDDEAVGSGESKVLVCRSVEPSRDWLMYETYTFTGDRLVVLIDFVTADVKTVKAFARKSEEQLKQDAQ